jgi:hypothetical protein
MLQEFLSRESSKYETQNALCMQPVPDAALMNFHKERIFSAKKKIEKGVKRKNAENFRSLVTSIRPG